MRRNQQIRQKEEEEEEEEDDVKTDINRSLIFYINSLDNVI